MIAVVHYHHVYIWGDEIIRTKGFMAVRSGITLCGSRFLIARRCSGVRSLTTAKQVPDDQKTSTMDSFLRVPSRQCWHSADTLMGYAHFLPKYLVDYYHHTAEAKMTC